MIEDQAESCFEPFEGISFPDVILPDPPLICPGRSRIGRVTSQTIPSEEALIRCACSILSTPPEDQNNSAFNVQVFSDRLDVRGLAKEVRWSLPQVDCESGVQCSAQQAARVLLAPHFDPWSLCGEDEGCSLHLRLGDRNELVDAMGNAETGEVLNARIKLECGAEIAQADGLLQQAISTDLSTYAACGACRESLTRVTQCDDACGTTCLGCRGAQLHGPLCPCVEECSWQREVRLDEVAGLDSAIAGVIDCIDRRIVQPAFTMPDPDEACDPCPRIESPHGDPGSVTEGPEGYNETNEITYYPLDPASASVARVKVTLTGVPLGAEPQLLVTPVVPGEVVEFRRRLDLSAAETNRENRAPDVRHYEVLFRRMPVSNSHFGRRTLQVSSAGAGGVECPSRFVDIELFWPHLIRKPPTLPGGDIGGVDFDQWWHGNPAQGIEAAKEYWRDDNLANNHSGPQRTYPHVCHPRFLAPPVATPNAVHYWLQAYPPELDPAFVYYHGEPLNLATLQPTVGIAGYAPAVACWATNYAGSRGAVIMNFKALRVNPTELPSGIDLFYRILLHEQWHARRQAVEFTNELQAYRDPMGWLATAADPARALQFQGERDWSFNIARGLLDNNHVRMMNFFVRHAQAAGGDGETTGFCDLNGDGDVDDWVIEADIVPASVGVCNVRPYIDDPGWLGDRRDLNGDGDVADWFFEREDLDNPRNDIPDWVPRNVRGDGQEPCGSEIATNEACCRPGEGGSMICRRSDSEADAERILTQLPDPEFFSGADWGDPGENHRSRRFFD